MKKKLIFLWFIFFTLFGNPAFAKIRKIIFKYNGRYLGSLNLRINQPYFFKQYYFFKPDFGFVITHEKTVNYKIVENKLFVNGKLRGLVVKGNADFKALTRHTDHIYLEKKLDDEVIEALKKIKRPFYLNVYRYHFEPEDLKKLRFVRRYLTYLNLSWITLKKGVKYLQILRNLKYLNLYLTRIKDEDLKYLQGLAHLTFLNIGNNRGVTENGFEYLEALQNLEYLKAPSYRITDKVLKSIGNLKKLNYLDLSHAKFSSRGMHYLKNLTRLESLNLKKTKISNLGLKALSALKSLKVLNLTWCYNFNDKGLAALQNLTNLKELYLKGADLGDKGVIYLSRLSRLKVLVLSDTFVTGKGLSYLKNLKALEQLGLSYIKAKGQGFRHLSHLTNLTHLDLSSNRMTEKTINYILPLKKLISLNLRWTRLHDPALRLVSRFKNLKVLNLRGNKLTDHGIKYLPYLRRLKELSLVDNKQISYRGVKKLQRLPLLKSLDVQGTPIKEVGPQCFKRSRYIKRYLKKDFTKRVFGRVQVTKLPISRNYGTLYPVIGYVKKYDRVPIIGYKYTKYTNRAHLRKETTITISGRKYTLPAETPLMILKEIKSDYLVAANVKGRLRLFKLAYSKLDKIKSMVKIKTARGKTGWVRRYALRIRWKANKGEEVKIAHILVANFDTARKIQLKLDQGYSFAWLAKRYSICPSKKAGGNLGWIDTAFLQYPLSYQIQRTIGTGYLKKIIKSKYGFHIIHKKGRIYKGEGHRFVYSM